MSNRLGMISRLIACKLQAKPVSKPSHPSTRTYRTNIHILIQTQKTSIYLTHCEISSVVYTLTTRQVVGVNFFNQPKVNKMLALFLLKNVNGVVSYTLHQIDDDNPSFVYSDGNVQMMMIIILIKTIKEEIGKRCAKRTYNCCLKN
jgi:hypothetical protein